MISFNGYKPPIRFASAPDEPPTVFEIHEALEAEFELLGYDDPEAEADKVAGEMTGVYYDGEQRERSN